VIKLADNNNNNKSNNKSKSNDDNITQIYDKILKRILTLSNVAVINFINGIFGKNYPPDSKLTYNWTENVKNSLEKTIADTIITVNDADKVHVEAQINRDNTIALRVFDYGYQDAVKYKKTEDDRIILKFPQSKIIYLEHTKNTPDSVVLELDFGKQGKFEYKVPTMKFLSYSIADLNEKHLVILLPLYLLKLRKEIEKEQSKKNALALKQLINEGIIKSIEDNERAGNITHDDYIVLLGLLGKLYAHLYGNIQIFKEEEVNSMVTEKLILDTDKLILDVDIAMYERDKAIQQTRIAEGKAAKADKKAKKLEAKALKTAQNMLDSGMTIEQIQSLTELPLSKIQKLQKKK